MSAKEVSKMSYPADIKFTAPRLYPTPPLLTMYSPTLDQPYSILDVTILLPPDVVPRAMFEAASGVLTISLRTSTTSLLTCRSTLGKDQTTVKYTIEVPSQWCCWEPELDGQSNGDMPCNEGHADHDASVTTTTTAATTNVQTVGGQFSPWKVQHGELTEDHKSIVGNEFNSFFRVVFFGKKVDIAEALEKKLVSTCNDGEQAQEVSPPSPFPLLSTVSPVSPLSLLDLPTLERC